jgi:hypothetical protein
MNLLSSIQSTRSVVAAAKVPTTTTYMFNGTADSKVVWGDRVSWTGEKKYITPIALQTKALLCDGWGYPSMGATLSTLSPITLPSDGYTFIFFHYSNDTGSSRWIMTLYDSTDFNKHLYFYMNNGKISLKINNTVINDIYSTVINDGVWRHIVLVFKEDTASTKKFDVYLNKTQVVTDYVVTAPNSTYTTTSLCQALTSAQRAFSGYIYKYEYRNWALSAAEVSTLY